MTQYLQSKLSALATWLGAWCKVNIDFALILAVCTETPRWAVVFLAIHEPLWIGIALGVLLAFATSKVWRFYFSTKSNVALVFNIAAIALAVLVISPVLYAMTEKSPHEINIVDVLQDWRWRAAWSIALALTTFVPLVQLAAVHGTESPVAPEGSNDAVRGRKRILQPDLQPTGMQPTEKVQDAIGKDADDAQSDELILHDDRLLDMQGRINALLSEGFDARWIAINELHEIAGTQLASLLNVNASTISRWRKNAQRNGHNKEAAL